MELISAFSSFVGAHRCCARSWQSSPTLSAIFAFTDAGASADRDLRLPTSVVLFLLLLLAVAALRIFELRISKRHQEKMSSRGASKVKDPYFRWMAMFHTLLLIGAAVEVVFLRRPLIPTLAIAMLCLFALANLVRWWVIRTLGEHWNVQVVDSTRLGFVSSGPFRYVRHPNYAAVFVEMIALPLIHTAWITALAGALIHIIILSLRLSIEDPILLANPDYAAVMGGKPRFLPGLF